MSADAAARPRLQPNAPVVAQLATDVEHLKAHLASTARSLRAEQEQASRSLSAAVGALQRDRAAIVRQVRAVASRLDAAKAGARTAQKSATTLVDHARRLAALERTIQRLTRRVDGVMAKMEDVEQATVAALNALAGSG